MSVSADPRKQHPGDGSAIKGQILGRVFPAAPAAKARQYAQPETAAGAAAAAAGFGQLTSLDNLFACWQKARLNKGKRERIQRFSADALHYLSLIQDRLRAGTFQFGPYKGFTVREKKFRDVIDAPMKDRIVHWMIYRVLLPIWQPRFIHDTYGNLPGRGTHAAVRRLADFARQPSNQWVLQLDVSKYFYAIQHAQIKAQALRYIDDYRLRLLIINLIDSFRTGPKYDDLFPAGSMYRKTAAKGMPIGNLPSQLFANIYLNDFDHWIKETLRRLCYIRYVDDMAILGTSAEELHQLADLIVARLGEDGLAINPRKMRIAPVRAGVPFLGYVVWPNHISAGQYLRRRYHHCLRQHEAGHQDRTEALRSYSAALAYTGHHRRAHG
jgi:RNA-directed DNA polymerase